MRTEVLLSALLFFCRVARLQPVGRVLVIVVAICTGCAVPVKDLFPPEVNAPTRSIYLVTHGNHAGIVIKRTDIPDGVWPEHNDFPESEYLEVGWGDRRFYQMPEPHIGIALKAILWPTSSVLHIVGFSGPVPAYFPDSEIIEIKLSFPGFEKLCRYIADSYAKDEAGHAIPLGAVPFGENRFYLSRETYHMFKTCNVWIARALRTAGCPITPAFAITVDSLVPRVRTFGVVVQSKTSTP